MKMKAEEVTITSAFYSFYVLWYWLVRRDTIILCPCLTPYAPFLPYYLQLKVLQGLAQAVPGACSLTNKAIVLTEYLSFFLVCHIITSIRSCLFLLGLNVSGKFACLLETAFVRLSLGGRTHLTECFHLGVFCF